MKLLSNDTLLDSYYKAVELDLDKAFISLLLAEIRKRKLNVAFYDEKAQAN